MRQAKPKPKPKPRKKVLLTSEQVALKHGFRSGLEEKVAEELGALNVPFSFEDLTIRYIKPSKPGKYTPDFILPNGIIIETKGRFVTADRQKHLEVKKQHPDLDIRFVFDRYTDRISKQSKTTYANWCEHKGYQWASKSIPKAWIDEPLNQQSLDAIRKLRNEH